MIIYVESNFVLEVALLQEQVESCIAILDLADAGGVTMVMPAFSIAEPYETLVRRQRERRKLSTSLNTELGQIQRSGPYREQVATLGDVGKLLIRTIEDEKRRLHAALDRMLAVATLLPLTAHTLAAASRAEALHGLSPQDAIIFASVMDDLQQRSPPMSCFLNRNSRDFDDPDIVSELSRYRCKMIPRFDHGLDFIRARITETGG